MIWSRSARPRLRLVIEPRGSSASRRPSPQPPRDPSRSLAVAAPSPSGRCGDADIAPGLSDPAPLLFLTVSAQNSCVCEVGNGKTFRCRGREASASENGSLFIHWETRRGAPGAGAHGFLCDSGAFLRRPGLAPGFSRFSRTNSVQMAQVLSEKLRGCPVNWVFRGSGCTGVRRVSHTVPECDRARSECVQGSRFLSGGGECSMAFPHLKTLESPKSTKRWYIFTFEEKLGVPPLGNFSAGT